MRIRHFSRANLAATEWKNGGGTTREIAFWPAAASLDDFGWRMSIATIAASGPFSVFAGVDRSIMLLEGDGVHLRSEDGDIDHRLDQPLRPFAFRGDASVACTLLGGASSDFNVMTRRDVCRAQVEVVEGPAWVPPAPHGVLLALQGRWRIGAGAANCSEGDGLCWHDAAEGWQIAPSDSGADAEARLLVVRILDTAHELPQKGRT